MKIISTHITYTHRHVGFHRDGRELVGAQHTRLAGTHYEE